MARRSIEELLKAIQSEPAPCYGCELRVRCGTEQLACEVFHDYVELGPRTKYSAQRHPTREIMFKVFNEGI